MGKKKQEECGSAVKSTVLVHDSRVGSDVLTRVSVATTNAKKRARHDSESSPASEPSSQSSSATAPRGSINALAAVATDLVDPIAAQINSLQQLSHSEVLAMAKKARLERTQAKTKRDGQLQSSLELGAFLTDRRLRVTHNIETLKQQTDELAATRVKLEEEVFEARLLLQQ